MTTEEDLVQPLPIVHDPTRAQSENIQTILSRLEARRVVIPDYQRDAEQWDIRKESIFIESLLNNLSIPAFFFAENPDGTIDVIDGQQRLNTIQRFYDNALVISDDPDIVYMSPQSVHYRGKRYVDLHDSLQNIFMDYPLTIIYLPRNLPLNLRLEIFRRINEGGTPLTGQDIRLSYYSDSRSVTYTRLAGTYAETPSARLMIESGLKKGVADPWKHYESARHQWREWWADKRQARGQTPSEMFLWYLVARYRNRLDQLLSGESMHAHLGLGFRGKTEEALDVYCAQLRYSDHHPEAPIVFPTYDHGLQEEFTQFVTWIEAILTRVPSVSVDKYKQTALLIGAAAELHLTPAQLKHGQWDAISEFIRIPRKSGARWLGEGGYPEPKGQWGRSSGQKVQCDQVVLLLKTIMERA